jgi:hypothetical protein
MRWRARPLYHYVARLAQALHQMRRRDLGHHLAADLEQMVGKIELAAYPLIVVEKVLHD